MTFIDPPLPGIRVDPQGQTVAVTITSGTTGTAPTVYADSNAGSTVSMPFTISAPKTFFLPNPGSWSVNGQSVTVEGNQVATVSAASTVGAASSVTSAANQSIATATVTVCTFDTVKYDNLNGVNLTAHNDRITVTQSGLYIVGATIWFTGAATGSRFGDIQKNSSGTPFYEMSGGADQASGADCAGSVPVYLTAGDYVQTRAYQSSGGNQNVQGSLWLMRDA